MDYKKYLQENHFESYFNKLKKELKDKNVIFYGAGEFFSYIYSNFDFSEFNVIGISDKSFESTTQTIFSGFKIIAPNRINDYKPDYIILSVLNWQNVLYDNYEKNVFSKNTKVIPILKQKSVNKENNIAKQLFNNYPSFITYKILHNLKQKQEKQSYERIKNNYRQVQNKIKRNNKKIKVAFLCSDDARWKCQSLYDLLAKDELFEPVILLSKLYTNRETREQTNEEFIKTIEFFDNQGMNIELAYNIENDEYLDLRQFSPDIVFYQLPFYCSPVQTPEKVSEFALTAYVPYYTGTSLYETKQDVRFRNKLFRYYLADEGLKEYYDTLMEEYVENIRIVGHPSFDTFYKKEVELQNAERFQVIYSPHHSIEKNSPLHLSTFLENGELILDFAKNHPEISWIFRPHPLLRKVLKTVWDEKRINQYFDEWEKIGTFDTEGNYMRTFLSSNLLINDCSFFREFFPTTKPIIQLINPEVVPYDMVSEEVIGACYNSHNNKELLDLLELLIEKKEDPLREKRLQLLDKLNVKDTNAALNILNDIKDYLSL